MIPITSQTIELIMSRKSGVLICVPSPRSLAQYKWISVFIPSCSHNTIVAVSEIVSCSNWYQVAWIHPLYWNHFNLVVP